MNFFLRVMNSINLRRLQKQFDKGEYLEAYARQTDLKAKIDPRMAIGGLWEEMGKHQFEFVRRYGLLPHHKFLDIGCGSLRGGVFFIDYLNVGNYTGFDISSKIIEAGKEQILKSNLRSKEPKLLVNETKNLEFDFLGGERFDYLLAQSVFSHLQPAHIKECFDNLHKVLRPNARFYFTYHPGEEFGQRSRINFEYPSSFFRDLAESCDYSLTDLSEDYRHPRGQRMILLQKKT